MCGGEHDEAILTYALQLQAQIASSSRDCGIPRNDNSGVIQQSHYD
jgi:hypothetical protein